ncbi:sialidase family protein [Sinomonas sp. ASV486]|uniref:sialidase family protein n=1 Tax=Sinomonas sp. ASV486 TaxID=3051170 RepID=UPI0027DC0164|nr:sialidase family protein [Sinomonas sp. ASV486]MDQ4490225.1 sialidase family protein [Sinomonas sp. ASV486]
MKARRALAVVALVGTLSLSAGFVSSAQAVNPSLDVKAHGHLDNGKALPHVSGGTEVTFDEERALGADAQSAASSDLPPDAAVSALGCANRGSPTNRRVNQDCTARRQAEEQVAVNPLDPTNVIAGQNDSRIGFNHCGFDYSLDQGATFGDGLPPFFQHLNPGTGHTYDAASDPNVTFNGAGVAWYSCVVFDVNSNATGLLAVPSTAALKGSAYANVGAGASKFVVAEANDGHTFYDKQFMAGDPRTGQKSVYVTFTVFNSDQKCSTGNNPGAYCSSEIFYSKWDATSQRWSPIANVSGSSPLCTGGNTFDKKAAADACNFDQGSMPVVDPSDGSVFVVWSNGNTPTALNQQLGRRINTDGTMGPVVKVGQDDESHVALCDFGRGPEECVKSLNVRTNDYPAVAVDPTNPNHLVAVWQDGRHAADASGTYNVVVSDSTNGGRTWTDAAGGGTVLDGVTGAALSQPSVAITRTGTTAVSFYNANPYSGTAVGGGTFGYGLRARAAGATSFSAYRSVSDGQAYPSPQANASQRGFLGDYSSIAASTAPGSNLVHAVWADTRNSGAAGPDEDVFLATITP